MPEPIYVLVSFVLFFIEVLMFAMLIRAILSWITDGTSRFARFLYVLTEPAIMPIRKLLVKKNWLQNSPIDFSFTITCFVLLFIEMLLSAFIG
ncbi:MAG: YggT family protein [Clostridia bacterium]|nr:YggT family protein [Clostridia bacterium]